MIKVFAFLRISLKDTGAAGRIRPLSRPELPAFATGKGLRRGPTAAPPADPVMCRFLAARTPSFRAPAGAERASRRTF
jgi:hypothetical protein